MKKILVIVLLLTVMAGCNKGIGKNSNSTAFSENYNEETAKNTDYSMTVELKVDGSEDSNVVEDALSGAMNMTIDAEYDNDSKIGVTKMNIFSIDIESYIDYNTNTVYSENPFTNEYDEQELDDLVDVSNFSTDFYSILAEQDEDTYDVKEGKDGSLNYTFNLDKEIFEQAFNSNDKGSIVGSLGEDINYDEATGTLNVTLLDGVVTESKLEISGVGFDNEGFSGSLNIRSTFEATDDIDIALPDDLK